MMKVLLVLWMFIYGNFAEQKKGFLVTAPTTLLADSHENVCVSLHNNTGPVQVSVTLLASHSSQVLATSLKTINSSSCLELYVPELVEAGSAGRLVVRLQAQADEPELSGNSEHAVQVNSDLVVLVSTDKPLYKPGQEVFFRVLSVTHKLKPHSGKIDSIWVETPTGIRIQQWRDVEVTRHGLVQLQFSLDKEPFLGLWRIKVQKGSSKIVDTSFWVKEYIPAKFGVTVQTPSEILPDSHNVSWQICAKYSYGVVVQGDVHVEIRLQGSFAAEQPSINHAAKLNSFTGCVSVTVGGSELGLADPFVHPTGVHITATVTERGTGITHSTSSESPVHYQAFNLEFQCSQYFKPGLPYKGNVIMKTVDGRLRLNVGEKIQVCVKGRYEGQLAMELLHCWNYTTDFNSHITFAVPNIKDPLNIQIITLIATAVEYPTKLYPAPSSVVMMLQPTVTMNIKPWFSPSHSYVDVFARTTLACGTTHMVSVYYNVPSVDSATPLFYYLMESRGDLLSLKSIVPEGESVVHSNDVSAGEVSLVRSWKLSIPVTADMSPQSHLTVYYVRFDGEVVAGSTSLVVDRCFQNKVRVHWDDQQVSPKSWARLFIRASPESVCGVAVTDKQLAFNVSQTTSDSERVWELLKRFTLTKPVRDQRLYCLNKSPKEEETPPDYELRRKRSISMFPEDYSDHVDSITAFDDIGVSIISNLVLETRPCTKPVSLENSYRRNWNYIVDDDLSDRSLFVENMVLVTQEEPTSSVESMKDIVRDYFPDTWIWSLAYVGKEGEVTVNSSVPDTITSWDTKVVCVSEKEGLGIAVPSTISVIMPFFIHIEAPYSLKKGESVKIKVVAYNYLYHSLPIVLRFLSNEKLHIAGGESTQFCVQDLSPHSYTVDITALTAGTVNLTVQAQIKPLASCGPAGIPTKSDTVIKQLLVRNDGFLQQKTQSAFICPSEDSIPSATWDLQLPDVDNLVEESASLKFTVVGDLIGPSLQNLDNLVLLPMGCGEQNLARLAPNVFVLKYMNALGSSDQELRATALKNVKKGYQRQLTFQRTDGAFSAFGDKDETGSMWLTAAVVKTLSEAREFVEIDEEALHSSIVWITRQQLENGCFPSLGQVFHRDIERAETEDSTAAVSALIIANLAGSGEALPSSFKSNAEFCLAIGISSTDPYTLALTTLALTRLGLRDRALEALHNLLRLAIVQNEVVHWGKPDASMSNNVAMTSYAILSLVELGGRENLLTAQKAIRWVSVHRNENGGFISTQDTVVALEALTKYVTALPSTNQTELVVFIRGGSLARTFRLSEENKLVQQQLISNRIPPVLSVFVVGEGCAFVQSVLKYNVRRPEAGSQLDLEVSTDTVSTVDPCSIRKLRMCAVTTRTGQVTNMALLTVMMVTGFGPDRSELAKISHPHIKKWEEEDDQITFYLSEISNLPICLNLRLVRKFEVEDPLPAPITLIDYYHPEITTSKSYSMECSPLAPLEYPVMLLDGPVTEIDRFSNFHNVDFELETPTGNEGPKPAYACPPNSTLPNC